MKDCEMQALSAIVYEWAVLMQGENDTRIRHGYTPAWSAESDGSPEGAALRAELERRGVLTNPSDRTRCRKRAQTG